VVGGKKVQCQGGGGAPSGVACSWGGEMIFGPVSKWGLVWLGGQKKKAFLLLPRGKGFPQRVGKEKWTPRSEDGEPRPVKVGQGRKGRARRVSEIGRSENQGGDGRKGAGEEQFQVAKRSEDPVFFCFGVFGGVFFCGVWFFVCFGFFVLVFGGFLGFCFWLLCFFVLFFGWVFLGVVFVGVFVFFLGFWVVLFFGGVLLCLFCFVFFLVFWLFGFVGGGGFVFFLFCGGGGCFFVFFVFLCCGGVLWFFLVVL